MFTLLSWYWGMIVWPVQAAQETIWTAKAMYEFLREVAED